MIEVNMTWQGAELLVLVLTVAVGMPVVLFYVIPNSSRSVYRYDLWRLYDDLIDDVRAGRLPKDEVAVRDLIRRVREVIDVAHKLSVPVLISVYVAFRDRITIPDNPSLAELQPDERRLINDYEARLTKTTVKYLLFLRPSGLLALPLLSVAAAADAWRRRRDPRLKSPTRVMERPVRTELVDADELFRILERSPGRLRAAQH